MSQHESRRVDSRRKARSTNGTGSLGSLGSWTGLAMGSFSSQDALLQQKARAFQRLHSELHSPSTRTPFIEREAYAAQPEACAARATQAGALGRSLAQEASQRGDGRGGEGRGERQGEHQDSRAEVRPDSTMAESTRRALGEEVKRAAALLLPHVCGHAS